MVSSVEDKLERLSVLTKQKTFDAVICPPRDVDDLMKTAKELGFGTKFISQEHGTLPTNGFVFWHIRFYSLDGVPDHQWLLFVDDYQALKFITDAKTSTPDKFNKLLAKRLATRKVWLL